ncbi:molybdopterin synthase catalytic subunit MoaE [Denitratisoma oestradiolicum]|uniref:Molybdopterin synthase catalytic subunit n=1 Tax=Denitratisoma oestradiolicum TaxID=311182 RepID=A0A6S6XQF2_9PROT|nr:molybdopterin synthase catalytic subunit MoaE [Denitratisoma oestradiolicum]TWO79440.1 molybdenum cofactor biosynthesis protein MoaE [Denitratisoma oestradiolicum]CAB1368151.1 molybdopterin synthase, large subunit [Denitratisoma oestradiolicum]
MSISVQTEDFDVGAEIAALSAGDGGAGAVASFVGLMRDRNDGAGVNAMTLEHYPGMTERALERIVAEARERWELRGVRVIHRVGRLLPGDRIVLVVVSSSHRGEAFAACEFIMDYLKTRAPLWKKEETESGGRWVDARETDEEAHRRWAADGNS